MLRVNASVSASSASAARKIPLLPRISTPALVFGRFQQLGRGSGEPALSSSARPEFTAKASSAQTGDSHAGHAFLHDFCMGLPYGAIACLVGAVLLFMLPDKQPGGVVLGSGAVTVAASVMSLKKWQKGGRSTPLTLLAAAASAAAGWVTWARVQAGSSAATGGAVPYWLSVAVLVLSAAFSVFGLYNVVAGGNPPKK